VIFDREIVTMRVGRLLLVVFLALVVTCGVSGCTAPRYPTAVDVYADGDRLVLVGDLMYPYGLSGALFQAATTTDGIHAVDVSGWHEAVHAAGPQRSSCLADDPGHCFRAVVGHLAVEESTDGVTWRRTWAVPDNRRAYLARQYPDLGSASANLSTIAVAAVSGPGGIVVAVANGRDGFALRDATGQWRRVGFPFDPPGRLSAAGRFIFYEYGVAVLLAAALILVGVAASRRDPGRRTAWSALLLLIPAVGWVLLRFTDGSSGAWPVPEVLGLLVIVPITVGAMVVGIVAVVRRRSRWRSGVAILAVPMLAGGVVAWTFYGWSAGWPASHGTASLIALAAAAAAAAAVLLLGRRLADAPSVADDVPAPGATFADVPPADPAIPPRHHHPKPHTGQR
jgi:hypothetical protein